MILIINICKERLHYLEFVKPIEDILRKENIEYKTIYYKKITDKELLNKKLEKIIICGTSLKDNEYLENLDYFKWLKFPKLNNSILGICGGMQIILLMFGGTLLENQEIGLKKIKFEKEFLGIPHSIKEVYLLHNYAIFSSKDFEVFSVSQEIEIPQAIKHKTKPIYGVLFHPEVRNKELIKYFCEEI